jgi:threonyl-tRNA synthetase
MKSQNIRAEIDLRNEKLNYKIREAQIHKIPFMAILGDKEQQLDSLSIRSRTDGDLGTFSFQEFIEKIKVLIQNKSLNLNIRG